MEDLSIKVPHTYTLKDLVEACERHIECDGYEDLCNLEVDAILDILKGISNEI